MENINLEFQQPTEVFELQSEEKVSSLQTPFLNETELRSANISLPAALCDDLLIQEINSIPDKLGFKIGEVADLLGIKQYVLRYWETEFDALKPKKATNNQRLYTKKDVENAYLIRKLLHRDRFSIEGARSAMRELKAHVKKEKDLSQTFYKIDHAFESIEDKAKNLAHDIKKVRLQLFS